MRDVSLARSGKKRKTFRPTHRFFSKFILLKKNTMPADISPQTSEEENTIRNIVTGLHKPSLLKSMCFNLELSSKKKWKICKGWWQAKQGLDMPEVSSNGFGFKLCCLKNTSLKLSSRKAYTCSSLYNFKQSLICS